MADTTNPVVVGVDGSFTAIRAAGWAAAVAERFAAPLLIVHAKPPTGHNLSDAIAAQDESAEAILTAAEQAVRGHVKDLPVATLHVDSPADEALVELSRGASLIVLGSDEVLLGTAILLGPTTTAVATRSSCPVVAWRGDATAPTRLPIVVGIDHDHDSRVAVTAAFEFAHRFGLGIIAVHAWSTRQRAGDVALPFMIDTNQLERAAEKHLSDALSAWMELYQDVEVSQIVDLDNPSRALLRRSRDAQMIVVGSRSRGLLAGAFLGSTGLNLLHHSAIPVMICRSVDADE